MHHEEAKCRAHGYSTKRFSEYHFKVTKIGSGIVVNVWPTAKKVLREWNAGPAPHYDDLISELEVIFSPKRMKDRIWEECRPTPEQAAHMEVVYANRDRIALLIKEALYARKRAA